MAVQVKVHFLLFLWIGIKLHASSFQRQQRGFFSSGVWPKLWLSLPLRAERQIWIPYFHQWKQNNSATFHSRPQWNFHHWALDYSHKEDNTTRKLDCTWLEDHMYSPPTGRLENCTYLSKLRAFLSHINHCCNRNKAKVFEMLNKTFFNDARCHA